MRGHLLGAIVSGPSGGGGGGGGAVPTGTGLYGITGGVADAAAKPVGAGIYAFLATPSSPNLLAALTTKTGTGLAVFGTSPTLTTPVFSGTPNFGSNPITTTGVISGACFKASGVANNGTTTSQTVTATALGEVRLTGASSIIAGINDAAALQGREVVLYAVGGPMTVNHEDASAVVSQRILTPDARSFIIRAGGSAAFFYDGTLSRWIVTGTAGLVEGRTTNATAGGTINNCTTGGKRVLHFSNASGPTVTGFDATGFLDDEELSVYADVGVVAITHEGVGSTASNRITLQGGITINIPIGCFTVFRYDAVAARWRHMGATAI